MSDWAKLATYNSERSRGIVHTPAYDEAMAAEQARFDEWQRRSLKEEGYVLQPNGVWYKISPASPRRWWQWRRR